MDRRKVGEMEKSDQIYIDFNPSGDYLWCSDAYSLTDNFPAEVDGDDYHEKHIVMYERGDIVDGLRARVKELETERDWLMEISEWCMEHLGKFALPRYDESDYDRYSDILDDIKLNHAIDDASETIEEG